MHIKSEWPSHKAAVKWKRTSIALRHFLKPACHTNSVFDLGRIVSNNTAHNSNKLNTPLIIYAEGM